MLKYVVRLQGQFQRNNYYQILLSVKFERSMGVVINKLSILHLTLKVTDYLIIDVTAIAMTGV